MSSIVIWQKGLPKIEKISFDYLEGDGFEVPNCVINTILWQLFYMI